jgi:signal transduction histidine kinase
LAADFEPAWRMGVELQGAGVKRPLFRRTAAFFIVVVFAALLADSVIEAWFSYQEHKTILWRAQRESAEHAATTIGQFVKEIETELRWTTQRPLTTDTLAAQQLDAQRLLRQAPAITELGLVDQDGHEQLRVSRVAMDQIGSGRDFSNDPAFKTAIRGEIYHGPVYFKDNSEPYLTLAVPGTRRANGVAIAEVNLKFIWDVISGIRVGRAGYAYVVDGQGRLIAHPDISLVLADMDVSDRPQVRLARDRAEGQRKASPTTDFSGRGVLSAFAAIRPLDWLVFVETPLAEAYQPLNATLWRAVLVLLGALFLAAAAGLIHARQMIVPIRTLQTGAARIGAGDFSHRIELHSGDELEALAHEFNEMADRLEASYADLEAKVEARTSELAEKSRELELASLHKSQFLANMSHELRTPLNSVLGFSEMLSDGIYGALPERALAALAKIQSNGRHLLDLINDVLDFSKIEAGRLTLSLAEYSMEQVVRSVVASLESQARSKGVALSASPGDGLSIGFGDERRITQVLLNLVSNALKFTDRGSIVVSAIAEDGNFEVSVRDTGFGIAAVDQRRIFDEFQQVDSSNTRNKGGAGLGLAISKRIVEMHGGRISVESTLGAGSTFRVVLPIFTAAEGRAA